LAVDALEALDGLGLEVDQIVAVPDPGVVDRAEIIRGL
jgi:hypothetical protein